MKTNMQKNWYTILSDRVILLSFLIVIMIAAFYMADSGGNLFAPYDLGFLFSELVSIVPLCLLALAEMFVILSGYSGIDLSVGGMLSLSGILFGSLINFAGIPVYLALIITVLFGGILGSVNGLLIGYFRFPALIATLATSYAYGSLALVLSDPISGGAISDLTFAKGINLGGGIFLPRYVITILLPTVIICWFALSKTRWGRSLYAVGTNDEAARFALQNVPLVRGSTYMVSGLLSGLAAVSYVAQFNTALPDAGSSGTGMALPAITIAVLGGVAITGGLGRVSGTLLAALLVTWLNSGILISFEGNIGPRIKLLALGSILIISVVLNTFSARMSVKQK